MLIQYVLSTRIPIARCTFLCTSDVHIDLSYIGSAPRGGDLVSTLPGCVCPKVKDMGPFWASRE